MRVEVVAPGGAVVASQTAPRGETVTFDANLWRDNPYEVICQMTPAGGQQLISYLPWYKGNTLAAARKLVASAKQTDQATPVGMTHAMLADMVRDRLGPGLSRKTPQDLATVHGALMEFAELMQGGAGGAAARDGAPRLPRWG